MKRSALLNACGLLMAYDAMASNSDFNCGCCDEFAFQGSQGTTQLLKHQCVQNTECLDNYINESFQYYSKKDRRYRYDYNENFDGAFITCFTSDRRGDFDIMGNCAPGDISECNLATAEPTTATEKPK